MNAAAVRLVNRASALLAQAPGADSCIINETRVSTWLTVRAMSEDVVHQLASLWDLGKVVERSTKLVGGGFRLYSAAGSEKTMRAGGRCLRIDVVGPGRIEGGPVEPES